MHLSNRTTTLLSAITVSLGVASASVAAQDWPQWRGANRDAKAAFTPPKTWPKELTQKWRITVGDGVATPALSGERLYVFSRENSAEVLRCLDASSGKEIWKEHYDALGATGPASSFSGPRSSPAVANGKVVTVGARGVLSCFNAADGKLLWRKDDFKGAWPRFFTSSSPVIAGQTCIAQLGGEGNGGIVAYDLASGAEKWRWTGGAPAYASPVLTTLNGAQFLIAQTETQMVALNVTDGQLVWETPYAPPQRGYNSATPIADGSTLIFAGSGRGTTAVKLEKEGDKLVARELWKNPDNSVQFSTPILKAGFVYGLSAANQLFCLNAQDGSTAWTAPVTPPAPAASGNEQQPGGGRGGRGGRGGGYGSLVDGGTVVLTLTPASELIAFEPSGKAYQEVARIKVADSPTHAYPVASGNRLFIKDQNSLTLWTVE